MESLQLSPLQSLLGRTLVLVAHPDDEAVGCGGLLQRMRDPIVVFATDGAPRSDYFWKQFGSRERYARVRTEEAERALAEVGVQHLHFLSEDNFTADQELFLNLSCTYNALAKLVEEEIPDSILSLTYEGGHPDHDSCSFLASVIGQEFELPTWVMPLYHRCQEQTRRQVFLDGSREISVELAPGEIERKLAMFARYESQKHVLAEFALDQECFRSMPQYDFSYPPHPGELNYEAWQWPMKGDDLCRAFITFLSESHSTKGRTCGIAA